MKMPPIMNKISRISVRDIRRIDLIKIAITQSVYLRVAMFDLGLQIKLAVIF